MNETSSLQATGFWLIPIILIATIVGLWLLVRYWRRQAREDLKRLRSEVHLLESEVRRLQAGLQDYSSQDGEPYGTLAGRLQSLMDELGGQLVYLRQQYIGIQEEIRRITANPMQAILGAPYFWLQIRREIASLSSQIAATKPGLESAQQAGQALDEAAWQEALLARRARHLHQQAVRKLESLRQHHVHGEAFDAATKEADKAQAALGRLPAYFFNATQETLPGQADKASAIQAHDVLAEVEPQLAALLGKLGAWEQGYAQATQKVSEMRQALGKAEQVMGGMPSAVVLDAQKKYQDGLSQIANSLYDSLSHLEVESMPGVAQESVKVKEAAEALDARLITARKQQAALEAALPGLTDGTDQLSVDIEKLSSRRAYPLDWNQSRPRLEEIKRRTAGLGNAQRPRSLEQLEHDLDLALRLESELAGLQRHSLQIIQAHTDLVALLEEPDTQSGLLWTQNTHRLLKQVESYSSENWPRVDAVGNLPAELSALEKGMQRLTSTNAAELIPEGDLPRRLAETRQFIQAYHGLRGRAANIESRLVELQHTENQAKEQFDQVRKTLGQASLLASSNPTLQRISAQELARLQDSAQRLEIELSQRQQGNVEKKARQAAALATSLEKAVQGWLDKLNQHNHERAKALAASLARLDEIAALDEPALAEARKTAADWPMYASAKAVAARPEEVIMELKRRCQYGQECEVALRKVQEIEKPLDESYARASQERQAARQLLEGLSTPARRGSAAARTWPPTAVTPDAERAELRKLDGQWEDLREKPARAIQLVQQFTSLEGRYHSLVERVQQAIERAGQDRELVASLESDLEEYLQLWQAQADIHHENNLAAQDIDDLLSRSEQELERIKQAYTRGQKDYAQVVGDLRSLVRKVRVYQVALDERHALDMHGRVIESR